MKTKNKFHTVFFSKNKKRKIISILFQKHKSLRNETNKKQKRNNFKFKLIGGITLKFEKLNFGFRNFLLKLLPY